MSVCSGTTQEQAATNRRVRDSIMTSTEVQKLFGTCMLEDGSKVVLDQVKASEHVRYVINDMKRSRHHIKDSKLEVVFVI